MEAFDAIDRPYARLLHFDREDGNKDRLYSYPARIETAAEVQQASQQFFYRAMKRDEAFAWIAASRSPDRNQRLVITDGHQGWASCREYSIRYLKRKNDYTYLLEVFAPEFLSGMRQIGYADGKAESGDISWGMGTGVSNSFMSNTPAIRRAIAEQYTTASKESSFVKSGKNSPNDKELAKALAPWVFKHSTRYVKVVNLRSQNPAT